MSEKARGIIEGRAIITVHYCMHWLIIAMICRNAYGTEPRGYGDVENRG